MRILLGTAIDKDHVNKLGWTALLEAVILGDGGPVHTEIVRLLVEAGANVNIADREGVTPLTHARRRGFARWCGYWRRGGVRRPVKLGRRVPLREASRAQSCRAPFAAARLRGGAFPIIGDDAERDPPRVGGLGALQHGVARVRRADLASNA